MAKRILIIDDDADLVQSIQAVLQAHGYGVESARNGTEGLAKIAADKPDLIVLDVMMDSDTEGFNVAYKLEADPATRRIPIILLTGFMDHMADKRDSFAVLEGREWPAVKLMPKPVNLAQLHAAVAQLLSEAQAVVA